MKKTAKKDTVFPHEFIGEEIIVVSSKNPQYNGIRGIIVDETKSTLTIQQDNATKILLKRDITFRLTRSGMIISGESINKRPEDRIKGK